MNNNLSVKANNKGSQDNTELLLRLAEKYIWWKTPEETITWPRRLIAQVMDIGIWEDILNIEDQLGQDALRDVITHTEAGWFHIKAWHFWHYRLELAKVGEVPPLPVRRFIKI